MKESPHFAGAPRRIPGQCNSAAAGPVLWHNGGTGGFRSFVAFVREANTAVVVLSNTARSVDRLGLRLLKALSSGADAGVG
jgi:CubicO group peptidase (beta-lactamase class C family)